MIEIICGEKGKGKTKELLEKVNHTVSTVTGVTADVNDVRAALDLGGKPAVDQCGIGVGIVDAAIGAFINSGVVGQDHQSAHLFRSLDNRSQRSGGHRAGHPGPQPA